MQEGERASRERRRSEGRPRWIPRNLLKNWLFCVCNTLYCLWNELLRKLGTLSTVSANNGKSSSSEDLTIAFRRTKHQASPKSFLFLGGLLNTETINRGKFLVKDQHHTREWIAMVPSVWPFGIAGPNPRVGPEASRPLPRAFFPRKEEEKGGRDGWQGCSHPQEGLELRCNFMSLPLRALLKSQCKSFIFWIYFVNLVNYWENSPYRMDYTSDAISQ